MGCRRASNRSGPLMEIFVRRGDQDGREEELGGFIDINQTSVGPLSSSTPATPLSNLPHMLTHVFLFFFSHRLCSSRGTAPPIVALFPNLDAITHRKRKENTCCTYTTTSPARVTKHEMKNCKKKTKNEIWIHGLDREKKKSNLEPSSAIPVRGKWAFKYSSQNNTSADGLLTDDRHIGARMYVHLYISRRWVTHCTGFLHLAVQQCTRARYVQKKITRTKGLHMSNSIKLSCPKGPGSHGSDIASLC